MKSSAFAGVRNLSDIASKSSLVSNGARPDVAGTLKQEKVLVRKVDIRLCTIAGYYAASTS